MLKMSRKKKHTIDKTSSIVLLDKEKDPISAISEGGSSSDDLNFEDHQFTVPAAKASHKPSKKRKLSELEKTCSESVVLEEQEINSMIEPVQKDTECLMQDNKSKNSGAKAKNENEFQEIRTLYSLAADDCPFNTRFSKRDTIGFVIRSGRKKYEQSLYEMPPGVGTPPEEIEDIPEELSLWSSEHEYLKSQGNFTKEEVAEVIEKKVTFLLDYFKRFEEGRLTKEERHSGKTPPENFNGPYLPTPKHIKILQRLDIEINWPLCPLHEACFRDKFMIGWDPANVKRLRKRLPGIQLRLGNITRKETQVLLKNWIRFQKEYKFYDIRPLLGAKCARLLETKSKVDCHDYNYVNLDTKNRFMLYLLQGLPDRTTTQIYQYFRDAYIHIHGNEFKYEKETKYSLFEKHGVEYIFKKFGVIWVATELLLGDKAVAHYKTFFFSYINQQNIPMRRGPWLLQESKRLEKGILTLLGVNSLKETVGRTISWVKLLPYVRTRPHYSYYDQYRRMLAQKEVIKKIVLPFSVEKQLIDSIYESGVESFQDIDWEDIKRNIPKHSVRTLKQHYRYLMIKAPVFCKRDFVETLEYLYKLMDDRYRMRNGLMGRSMGIDSTTEEEDFPDSSNMSVLSDTTFAEGLDSDWSFVNEVFDD